MTVEWRVKQKGQEKMEMGDEARKKLNNEESRGKDRRAQMREIKRREERVNKQGKEGNKGREKRGSRLM